MAYHDDDDKEALADGVLDEVVEKEKDEDEADDAADPEVVEDEKAWE